jgi:tetratricopeptide (TPR) repeat protein
MDHCFRSRNITKGIKALLVVSCLLLVFSCAGNKEEKSYELTQLAFTNHWGSNWGMVIELTTQAIEADPKFPWPYSMRGAAYNVLGKYDLALKDLDKALQLKPDYSSAYTNRAITFIRKEEYDNAVKDLEAALEYHPFDLTSLVKMAEVHSLLENEEEACSYMEEAIRSGFRELNIIEANLNFQFILYSDCFEELEELYETLKKQSPPPRY